MNSKTVERAMTLILMKMKFHLQVVTKMLANRNMTTYTSTVYV